MASCTVAPVMKEKVVQQLNELFGNVLNLDVIKTVAVSCEFDGKYSIIIWFVMFYLYLLGINNKNQNSYNLLTIF